MSARLDRDPLTLRMARTLEETRRDPFAWWEPHIDMPLPTVYRHTWLTRLSNWLHAQFC